MGFGPLAQGWGEALQGAAQIRGPGHTPPWLEIPLSFPSSKAQKHQGLFPASKDVWAVGKEAWRSCCPR